MEDCFWAVHIKVSFIGIFYFFVLFSFKYDAISMTFNSSCGIDFDFLLTGKFWIST